MFGIKINLNAGIFYLLNAIITCLQAAENTADVPTPEYVRRPAFEVGQKVKSGKMRMVTIEPDGKDQQVESKQSNGR